MRKFRIIWILLNAVDIRKQLDKVVYKAIILPLLISLVILTGDFLNGFNWTVFIPVIVATLTASIFEINKQYLIRLDREDKENIKLTYYNYLDKIVIENINRNQLSKHKISKSKKVVTLRFLDNRELKLYCVDGVTVV